jgi:hypothetical protein
MSGRLQSYSIVAPGFLGLNTQESGVTLESGYATTANNCIIDKFGRLGSRRGWVPVTTNNGSLNDDEPIESLFEFVDINRDVYYISSGGNKIFVGSTTLVAQDIYGPDSGGPVALSPQPTFTANNWQWVALPEGAGVGAEGYAFGVQSGNPMLVWREADHSGPRVFQRIGDYGTVPSGLSVTTFDPNCILAAFGRVWVAGVSSNKATIYYSRLLDGAYFTGSGAGLVDISSVVGNNDEVVAIASHNKYLVVFCTNNIVIYANADDPTAITVADVITGVGCIARDSVQQTGNDLIFLSKSGVRSLARTINEDSMPMRELSLNVSEELSAYVAGEEANTIKSAYYERDAFYLLTLKNSRISYYFDLRQVLENGAARVTTWRGMLPSAYTSTRDRQLLLGFPGKIGKYFGYLDNEQSYRMDYYTSNIDGQSPTTLKLLKKANLVIIGSGTQDFLVKYAFDYKNTYTSRILLENIGNNISEYNISEYGIGEYGSGITITDTIVQLGGSGKVVQFGIEAPIKGSPVSIQKMDIYVKLGRTI